jgi:hypothetical protein
MGMGRERPADREQQRHRQLIEYCVHGTSYSVQSTVPADWIGTTVCKEKSLINAADSADRPELLGFSHSIIEMILVARSGPACGLNPDPVCS